eukprot:1641568-Rhodomonas_salina.2
MLAGLIRWPNPDGFFEAFCLKALVFHPACQREVKGTAGAGDAIQWSAYLVHDSGLFVVAHWGCDEEASVHSFLDFVSLDESLAQVDTVKFQTCRRVSLDVVMETTPEHPVGFEQ